MSFDTRIQQKISKYRQANPKLKTLSDKQILSILVKNGEITLTVEQKRSIFTNAQIGDNNLGLQIEKTTKPNPKKTIYLQSGRKVVYSRLADGRTVMQYFGADGTPIKPDYFKKVEGQISIAANGASYTVTKNGKKRTLKAKNPTQGAVDQNLARLNNEEKRLNKTKKEQGWIGKGWDWVKNKTGIGDGSEKAQQQINIERKLLNQVKTGKISKKDFKAATGVEYTKENLEKFKRGELSQVTAKINGYKEGQEMATDVVGDMVSGIAAVTIYTAAVAAAPFTGGASIALGVAVAATSGALIKAGVKALDTVGTDKKYTMKDFGHDLATGAFSGALAPITGGFGGAVGKTVATKLGIQAVKQVGKEVAEEVVETGVKQGLKTALTNPAGYEYVGGTLLKRGTAMAAEMATDGALGGAIDGGFRAGLDNNWDTEAMLDGAVEGGIGGAIMSPIIGGGFKVMGKGAQKVFGKENVHINEGNRIVRDDVVSDFLDGKVDDKYIAAVLRDVDDLEQAFQVAEKYTNDKVKLAEAKKKILEKVNQNIVDHGSIVLQSEIPTADFLVDPKSGVKYAIASQDDMFLAHAVPEGKEIESLLYLIDVTNKKSDDAYLSLSLVNKNSSFFGDGTSGLDGIVKYGIIPKNRSKNVTSAGFGQVSDYKKDFSTFVQHQSLGKLQEEYIYLKNSFLKALKDKGYDLTDKDYIALFNELKNKEFFNEITDDIKIGDKVLKANELRDALEISNVKLSAKIMYGQGSNNEVSSIIDGIRAIFARVDNIDDVKPEIKKLAKNNGLDIVLLGKPTKLDITSNPQYQSELKSIEQAFKDGKINMLQRMQQKRKLRTKYEAPEIDKLRARTSAEQENDPIINEICFKGRLLRITGEKYFFIPSEDIAVFGVTIPNTKNIRFQYDVKHKLINFGTIESNETWECVIEGLAKNVRKLINNMQDYNLKKLYSTQIKTLEKLDSTSDVYKVRFNEIKNIIEKIKKMPNGTIITGEIVSKNYIRTKLPLKVVEMLDGSSPVYIENFCKNGEKIYEQFYDPKGKILGRRYLKSRNYVIFDEHTTSKGFIYNEQNDVICSFVSDNVTLNGAKYKKGRSSARAVTISAIPDYFDNFNDLYVSLNKKDCEFSKRIESILRSGEEISKIKQLQLLMNDQNSETFITQLPQNQPIILSCCIFENQGILIGTNRVVDDNVQFERLAMLSNMNIYEGYCAETSLLSLIDDAMSGCEVFNFKLEYQKDMHSYKVSESTPCSTCTVNLGLHDAKYKSIKK